MSLTKLWFDKWLSLRFGDKTTALLRCYEYDDSLEVMEEADDLLDLADINDDLIWALIKTQVNLSHTVCGCSGVGMEKVFKLVKNLYFLEIENFNHGKYTFYHCQSSDFSLLNYAVKLATNRKYPRTEQGEIVLPMTATRNYIKDFLASSRAIESSLDSRLFPVNFSIFGNFGNANSSENTLHHLFKNKNSSSAHDYLHLIPYISDLEKRALAKIFDDYEEIRYEHHGSILAFVIPIDKVDFYLFNSLPGNNINDIPIFSDLPLKQLSFCNFNELQGTIIDFHLKDPLVSLAVFEDQEPLKLFKTRIEDILLNL